MNCLACFLYLSLILVVKVKCQSDEEDQKFYPSQHDEDENFPIYPFQQYIQVRKSLSVEHVPLYASGSDAESKVASQRSDDKLEKAASSNDASSSGSYGGDEQHYYKPPLKEEIFLHKKQEVYEEKGYHDSDYDHYNHGDYARDSQPHYQDGGHASESSPHYSESHDQPSETQQNIKSRTTIPTEMNNNRYRANKPNRESQTGTTNWHKIPNDLHARRQETTTMITKPPVLRTSATNKRTSTATVRPNRREALGGFPARKALDSITQMTNAPENQSARRRPIGADDATSTRVLEHIANNLYDHNGHAVGFYKARSHIRCPDFIDFDLSSNSQKMGQGLRPKGKPRLSGLGPKIDCHKHKYWGEEILPSSVFMDPSESRHSEIKIGTMDDFMADLRRTFYG